MLWLRDHPVSIHALLAECDTTSETINQTTESFNPRTPCGVRRFRRKAQVTRFRFQSTHSLRSATHGTFCPRWRTLVSIHALLAECDRTLLKKEIVNLWFQSTHSLRSATRIPEHDADFRPVSIHALLAECDVFRAIVVLCADGFNPRTPCGVRLRQVS